MASSVGEVHLGDLEGGPVSRVRTSSTWAKPCDLPQFSDLGFELLLSSQGLIRRTRPGGRIGGRPSLVDSQLLLVALQSPGEFLYPFVEMLPAGFSTNECLTRLAQLLDLARY